MRCALSLRRIGGRAAAALAGLLAGGLWALAEESGSGPVEEAFSLPALLAGESATGDWFGLRGRVGELGLEVFGSYTVDVWGNVGGGGTRGAVYTGLLEFGATLDLEALAGWKGAAVHNSWLWLSGKNPSDELAGGDVFAVSNIAGFNTLRMFELWLEQKLWEEAFSLRVGQLAADTEFAVSEYAGLFLSGTFGFPLALTESLPNGGPQYPLATPGIRLEVKPSGWLAARAAVFQGDPFAEDVNRHGFRYRLDGRTGALFLNEAELGWSGVAGALLPGSFKAGAWFHTARFADPGNEAITRQGNAGFYFILDQSLYRPASRASATPGAESKAGVAGGKNAALGSGGAGEAAGGGGLGAFARLAFEPADRNTVSFYADAGLVYQGLLPGRPDDSLGIAVALAKPSPGTLAALRAEGATDPGASLVLEAAYQVQVTPWWVIQPDLQFILRPGGTGDVENALLLGIRSTVEF